MIHGASWVGAGPWPVNGRGPPRRRHGSGRRCCPSVPAWGRRRGGGRTGHRVNL